MKTKASFIDLTHRPPRSFRVRLGNYVILARMLDKGRATVAGKNGEYRYNSTADQRLVQFLGFDPDALLEELATGNFWSGFSPIPRRRVRRGRSKCGLLSWKSADRTATRKHLPSLPNTWASFPKPAKTSKLGLKPLNSMTTPALEEKHKSGIQQNNEEQKKEKQKRRNL
jgi:hypothetical protein